LNASWRQGDDPLAGGGVGFMNRPQLGHALVRRELTLMLVAMVLLAGLLAVGAAHEYGRMLEAGDRTPVLDRMLRRFDLTMMYLMALLVTLRLAARAESDHVSGWLEPVFAAGGSRWAYGVQLTLVSLIPPAAIFAVTAVAFAIGVDAITGSAELLTALPRTVGGGILVLGTFGVCAGLLGVLLRSGPATLVLTLLLLLVPFIGILRYASAGSRLPAWLVAVAYLSPLPVVPEPDVIGRGIVYIAVGLAAVAVASHLRAGRRP
jgi:hypothetical protein